MIATKKNEVVVTHSYWRRVHAKTWELSTKAAGLESRDKAIMLVAVQAGVAAAIYFGTQHWDLLPRVATVALPSLLLPIWYLVKLLEAPRLLDAMLQQELLEARATLALVNDAVAHSLIVSSTLNFTTMQAQPQFELDLENPLGRALQVGPIEMRLVIDGQQVWTEKHSGAIIQPRSLTCITTHLPERTWAPAGGARFEVDLTFGAAQSRPTRQVYAAWVTGIVDRSFAAQRVQFDETALP